MGILLDFQLAAIWWNVSPEQVRVLSLTVTAINLYTFASRTQDQFAYDTDAEAGLILLDIIKMTDVLNEPYPWKTPNNRFGLQLILDQRPLKLALTMEIFYRLYLHHVNNHEGVLFLIHSPFDFPNAYLTQYHARFNEKSFYWISPRIKNIDESLYQLSPDK